MRMKTRTSTCILSLTTISPVTVPQSPEQNQSIFESVSLVLAKGRDNEIFIIKSQHGSDLDGALIYDRCPIGLAGFWSVTLISIPGSGRKPSNPFFSLN